jgi:hypothetical protein
MGCENGCYEAIIECCNSIVVKASFPPNYGLYWVVNKIGSNKIHQRLTQTNSQGDLIIDKAALPLGYLVTGNQIKIQIKDGANYLQPITFVFGGKNYNCTIAQLSDINKQIGDNSGVNVIQFTEAIVPGNGGGSNDSIVVPFVNQTSITYNHNLGRIVDVTIYDLSGNIVIATVTEDTVNHNFITVSFTSSTSGRILID